MAAVLGVLSAPTGCDRALNHGRTPPSGGAAGNAGATAGNGGASSGGASGAAGGGGALACNPLDNLASKRIVRLTFHQIATAIGALLGPEVVAQLGPQFGSDIDGRARAFPPLASPREGSFYLDYNWPVADGIAQRAAQAVLDGFPAITSCSDTPTADCGRGFLLDFARRAYRRPLSADESQSLLTVYDETRDLLGVKEAVQSSVQAVLEAPGFLYRTELGTDGNQPGMLAPYELASALAFFLTDGPPDQPLLAAAAGGYLNSDADFAAQVSRLLATDGVRQNLEVVMASAFALPNLDSIVLDTSAIGFDPPIASMYGEATRFFHDTLWDGTIPDLLTSRRSRIDAKLAAGIYGVAFPPPGALLDADGFAPVELPGARSGLLTQPALLVARARPSNTSIVARGLMIRTSILCAINPPFEEPVDPATMNMPDAGTATQRANARIARPVCAQCHAGIDPYGIALEHFDVIGRFRDVDETGRPIDSTTVLPPLSGGAAVADAAALGRELVKGDRFVGCLTQSLLTYALMELGRSSDVPTPESCANRALVGALPTGPARFAELVRQIALSPAFRQRRAGGVQ